MWELEISELNISKSNSIYMGTWETLSGISYLDLDNKS